MRRTAFLILMVGLSTILPSIRAIGSGYRYVGSIGAEIPAQYFVSPVGICSDGNSIVCILDGSLNRLFLFDAEGSMIRSWGNSALNNLKPLDLGILMSCSGNGVIGIVSDKLLLRFDLKGKLLSKVEIPMPQLFELSGIAADPQGAFYLTDRVNSCIYKASPDGKTIDRISTKGRGSEGIAAPTRIVVDPEGNLLVGDSATTTVQRLDPSGMFLGWSVGGLSKAGGVPEGSFGKIGSLTISKDGTLFVEDDSNGLVSRFDRLGKYLGRYPLKGSDGDISAQWIAWTDGKVPGLWSVDLHRKAVLKSDPTTGKPFRRFGSIGEKDGEIAAPSKLAVDPDGNLYVVDLQRGQIAKFAESGKLLGTIGNPGSGKGEIGLASGLVLDPERKLLYVADSGNNRIEKFSLSGGFLGDFRGQDVKKEEWSPLDIAIDKSGHLFAPISIEKGGVDEFSPDGTFLRNYLKGKLEYIGACLPDNAGNLYVGTKNWVDKYNLSSGERVGRIGGVPEKGESEAGKLHYPVDIKSAPNGHILVVDVNPGGDGSGRVQEFDASGGFITQIGGADSGAGAFFGASAVAAGKGGDIFVSDVGNHRIVHFAPVP